MKHIETLCINCEDDSKTNTHNSHVIRLSKKEHHAYAIFISKIGEVFFIAQQLQSEGVLDGPYRLTIIIPKIECFETQPETNLSRIKFIVNNFVPPSKGIIITFVEHQQSHYVLWPYSAFWVWPYKDQWQKENTEDYVAIQSVKKIINQSHRNDLYKLFENLIDDLETRNINYKFVGYDQTIEELYNTILKSKLLFSPASCSYYIAGGLNVPTYNYDTSNVYGWGMTCLVKEKLLHYDQTKGIHNRAVSNLVNSYEEYIK